MTKKTWLRDALHDLRRFAKAEGLDAADDALRIAIIRISCEQRIATKLPLADLLPGITLQTPFDVPDLRARKTVLN